MRIYISDIQKVDPERIMGKVTWRQFSYDVSERAEDSDVYLFKYFTCLPDQR